MAYPLPRKPLAKESTSYAESPYPHTREGSIAERHVVRTYGRLMDLRTDPETGNIYPSPYSCEGHGKIVDVTAHTGKEAVKAKIDQLPLPNVGKKFGEEAASSTASSGSEAPAAPGSAYGQFSDNEQGSQSQKGEEDVKGFTSYGTYSYFRTKHARLPYHAKQRFQHPEFPGPFTGNQDIGWDYEKDIVKGMNGGDRGRAKENGNWFPINSSKMTKFRDNLSQMGIQLHKK